MNVEHKENTLECAVPVDGRSVANYILDDCERRKIAISNMKLQKLVYFCHAWHLVEFQSPLIKHQFEAWEHGPVLHYLYREFKKFGKQPISSRATGLDPKTGERIIVSAPADLNTRAFIDRIINFYGRLDAIQLRNLSHEIGGPWYKTWHHGGKINLGMKIDDKDIAMFYKRSYGQVLQ